MTILLKAGMIDTLEDGNDMRYADHMTPDTAAPNYMSDATFLSIAMHSGSAERTGSLINV